MTSLVFRVHSPLTFLLAPGVFIGLLWLFAPIDFNFPGDLQVLFYSIFIVFLFGLGLLCGSRQWRTVSVVVDVSPHRVRRLIYLLMIMGFGGLLLRAYERVFLRAGGEIGGDFMANRELFASGGGSSGLALFAGFFATWLMFLPCAVMLLRKTGDARWRYRLLALLSLAYPGFDMLLQGSRSTLVMYSGIVAVCFITLNRFRFTPRTLFMLVVSLVVLPFSFWLMGQVFAMRALQMGLDPIRSMTASGYAYFAPASAALVHYLNSTGMEGLNGFIYAYTHACQYLLHGMYEFFYVLANTNGSSTEGLQTFYIPSKILSKLGGGGTWSNSSVMVCCGQVSTRHCGGHWSMTLDCWGRCLPRWCWEWLQAWCRVRCAEVESKFSLCTCCFLAFLFLLSLSISLHQVQVSTPYIVTFCCAYCSE